MSHYINPPKASRFCFLFFSFYKRKKLYNQTLISLWEGFQSLYYFFPGLLFRRHHILSVIQKVRVWINEPSWKIHWKYNTVAQTSVSPFPRLNTEWCLQRSETDSCQPPMTLGLAGTCHFRHPKWGLRDHTRERTLKLLMYYASQRCWCFRNVFLSFLIVMKEKQIFFQLHIFLFRFVLFFLLNDTNCDCISLTKTLFHLCTREMFWPLLRLGVCNRELKVHCDPNEGIGGELWDSVS